MITQVEVDEVMDNLKTIGVMDNHILVLVQTPQETTESGIIKGEAAMKAENDAMESFMTVVKVADNVEDIKPNYKVFTQGQVIAFTDQSNVRELDIAPEGYAIGLVATPYVKLYIKA